MLITLSTWSRLQIRMQDTVTELRMIIVPLKGWKSSNIGNNVNKSNSIQEEIKSRLKKSGNAGYHSMQNFLSSSLLSNNIGVMKSITIILSVVLCVCETWSLTLREECRLRVSENRVLRWMFGPRDEVTQEWRKLHSEELNDLYA